MVDAKAIVLAVILLLIVLWCMRSEWQDVSSGRSYHSAEEASRDESHRELLSKLLKTTSYDLTHVHWRRIMLVAIVTPVVAFPIAEGTWPSIRSLTIAIIVGFLVGYAFQIHFQTTVVRPALQKARRIAKLLE